MTSARPHESALGEIGSEFEWPDPPTGEVVPWPAPHVLFGLAQHALIGVWRALRTTSTLPTLWVPDYFCPPVVDAWRRAGVPIAEYPDDPRWLAPRWGSVRPAVGDAVLAVNYFGLRTPTWWQTWKTEHDGIILIEDHSHDPVSEWARTSTADYAFASLRKTMPVPDGAIVWSPRHLRLPDPPSRETWTGSALKLAAMMLKREYLAGTRNVKDAYRELQTAGEDAMLSTSDLAISPWSRILLGLGMPSAWRQRRYENVQSFLTAIGGACGVAPLIEAGTREHPFNAVVAFEAPAMRELVRQTLVRQGVYPAIHWIQPAAAPPRVRQLSARILTLPLDQRYRPPQARRVALMIVDAMHAGGPRPARTADDHALS